MADDAPDTKASEAPDGVFGNLPAARPGTRSPRRRTGGEEGDAIERSAAKAEQPAAKPPPPQPEATPTAEDASEPAQVPPGQRIGSIEDLAWAGVAVAAQAATVGVKFASRALEAARKSADRPD